MSTKENKAENEDDQNSIFIDIHYDDAVAFLSSKSPDMKCPMCSSIGWNLSVNRSDIMREFSIPLTGDNTKVYRMIMATCQNCGFASMHHIDVIYKWIKEQEPEAEQDDDEEQ